MKTAQLRQVASSVSSRAFCSARSTEPEQAVAGRNTPSRMGLGTKSRKFAAQLRPCSRPETARSRSSKTCRTPGRGRRTRSRRTLRCAAAQSGRAAARSAGTRRRQWCKRRRWSHRRAASLCSCRAAQLPRSGLLGTESGRARKFFHGASLCDLAGRGCCAHRGTAGEGVLSFAERLAGVFCGQPDSFAGNLETADTAASQEMVAAERHHQSQLGLPPFPKPIGGVCAARAAPPQRMKFATDCRGCACVAADESAKQTWTTAFRSGLVAQLHAPPPLPPSRPPPTLAHRLRRAAASTEAAVVVADDDDDAPQSPPPRPLLPSMPADASDAAVTAAAARPPAAAAAAANVDGASRRRTAADAPPTPHRRRRPAAAAAAPAADQKPPLPLLRAAADAGVDHRAARRA